LREVRTFSKLKLPIFYLNANELEIVLTENIGDLKRLKATRNEESISFNQYIKNEN
jgi:hypothetical protein